MIVLPPETFEKWKHIITDDTQLSALDKEMKKILYNKKLNALNKWHYYRENLMSYMKTKKTNDRFYPYKKQQPGISASTQVNEYDLYRIKNNKIETPETNVDVKQIDNNINIIDQTEWIKPKKFSKRKSIPKADDIYERNPFDSLEEKNISIDSPTKDLSQENEYYDPDDSVRAAALEGFPENVKIVKEGKSYDPDDYRTFQLSNNKLIKIK